jgi:hypothetical protein
MNYKIIQNEQALKEFIDSLPNLQNTERFYVALIARKKYCSLVQNNNQMLRREIVRKDNFIDRLKQWETPLGSYKCKGGEVPQTALACYVNMNPRCLEKAGKKLLITLAGLVTVPYNNYNPYKESLNAIQTAKSRGIYITFDFDQETEPNLEGLINPDSVRVLKTRGGFDVIVILDKVDPKYKKTWHKNISALGVDASGDMLTVIPGTCQGGFVPYFIK